MIDFPLETKCCPFFCGRSTQYACFRISVIVFQTLFVCSSLVRVPESRVNWGSGDFGGLGALFRVECKEGHGFQKPWAFWSKVRCLGNQTANQRNSRKSWTLLFLLIPDNADTIC